MRINKNITKKALTFFILVLFISSIGNYCVLSSNSDIDTKDLANTSLINDNYAMVHSESGGRSIIWDVQLDFDETGGNYDYVVFGEATNATDGPPNDDYDMPKPLAPPPSSIYAWFDDNLNEPYDKLLKDYRGYYNMNYKQWNLSVQWMSYSGGTNLNISWNINDLDDSEYDSITLYYVDNNVEVDMLTNSFYEFSCPAWIPQEFTINCSVEDNLPPIANFTYEPASPSTSDLIYFNSTSSDSDGSIVNWTWDFDDGSFGYGEQVTHQYDDNGSFDVELTVMDDDGAIDTDSKTVSVSNTPPVADFTFEPASPSTSDLIYFNSTSSDSDGSIVNWTWDFDDGSFGYGEQVTHQYDDDGSFDVELTVMDDDGATDTDTNTVNVANIPPVAVDDTDSTPEDSPVIIDVVDNDYDIDGEIDVTTVVIVDDADHGETSVNPTTGEVTYTPDQNYFGSDSFTYTVDDDDGDTSNEATVDVTITSVNDAPVAMDDSANTPQDTQVLIDVLANDYDIDSDIDEKTVQIIDDVSHGTTSVNENNGVVTYIPQSGYYGLDSFTYTVDDEEGKTSNIATVNISVGMNQEPDKPEKPSGQTRGKWGEEYTYKTSTTDPESNQIWYNFSWGDGTYSGWIGPYTSGATAEAKHSWDKAGWSQSYQIRVIAKDEHDALSDWSDPLPITMPKSFRYNFFSNYFNIIILIQNIVKFILNNI